MKRCLKIMIAALMVALCASFVGYSYNLNKIQMRLAGGDAGNAGRSLKYHFMLIAQDTGNNFWQSVKAGAEEAAAQNGAAVEFLGPLMQDEDQALECMDIAIASRVHGIGVYVTDEARFQPLIDKAVGLGIPVITIESDAKGSKRSAFVGPNSYMAGRREAELVIAAANGAPASVAVIVGGNYSGNDSAADSLLAGFADGIQNTPAVKLLTTQYANTGSFSAETAIRKIVSEYPGVNSVVCTGFTDTLEVVQVLIDLNRKNIAVIGYNNTPQIREYIKRYNLYGSVYEFPRHTGLKCVEDLVRCLEGQPVQEFDDTGVYTVTRSNLVSYPSDS